MSGHMRTLVDQTLLFQRLENSSASRSDRVHGEPQLLFVLWIVLDLVLVSVSSETHDFWVILGQEEDVVGWRRAGVVKNQLNRIKHDRLNCEFPDQSEGDVAAGRENFHEHALSRD